MPKIRARVLDTKIEGKEFLAKLSFNGKLPRKDEYITCQWGAKRSDLQNSFYWLYLTFLFEDCNLKEEYNTIDELHETLKATFLSKRIFKDGLELIQVGSTTKLDKVAFGEYLEKINKAMVESLHLNTAPFFEEYETSWKM